MSRQFRDKNKDLVNLEIVPSSKVWIQDKKGDWIIKKDLQVYGKIEKGSSAFIINTNRRGKNAKFVEDTAMLPKRVKNDIVKHFFNEKNRVAYLVKKGKIK